MEDGGNLLLASPTPNDQETFPLKARNFPAILAQCRESPDFAMDLHLVDQGGPDEKSAGVSFQGCGSQTAF